MSHPIFIHGVTERSGTNFLSGLIQLHPDCFLPAPVWENYLLKPIDRLAEYADLVVENWDFGWGVTEEDKQELVRSLVRSVLGLLEQKGDYAAKHLLTKTPNVSNLNLFFRFFPNAKLIILVRDGRAVVESTINSFNINFDQATAKWVGAAETIVEFEKKHALYTGKYKLVRYEDLHGNTEQALRDLFEFLELDAQQYPFDEALNLPVRGSSKFRGEDEELHWEPVAKTAEFKPLERFRHWGVAEHQQFNKTGSALLEYFGYTPLHLDEPEILSQPQNRPGQPASAGEMPVLQRDECLYCKRDGNLYQLDDDKLLYMDQQTGKRVVISYDSAQVWRYMNGFRPLDEHIRDSPIQEYLDPKIIEQFAHEFVREGMLQTADSFIADLKQHSVSEERKSVKFGGVVIRTCERPDYLQQLLASLEHRNTVSEEIIFILDDSRSAEAQEKNREIVEQEASKQSCDIRYLGPDWQRVFMEDLYAAFPDSEQAARWLLNPREAGQFTGGRLLNLALLFLAGRRLVTYDDDYLLDAAREMEGSDQDTLSFHVQPEWSVQGYDSAEELLYEGVLHDADPVSAHAAAVGMTLSQYLASRRDNGINEVSVEGLQRQDAEQFQSDSPILTTGNGLYGRPIEPSGRWIYTQTYQQALPPWNYSKSYLALREGEYYWKAAHNTSVLTHTLSTPAGIDNTRLLPPTIPVGKSEDTLFGLLLRAVYPHAVHVEFPWAVGHFREPRNWKNTTLSEPMRLNLAALTWSKISAMNLAADYSNAEVRMSGLGDLFIEWAEKSSVEIKKDILETWVSRITGNTRGLNRQLEKLDAKEEECREDIQRLIRNNYKLLASLDPLPVLDDAACPQGEAAQIDWIRSEFREFGNALQLWPKLWNYCREKNDDSIQV